MNKGSHLEASRRGSEDARLLLDMMGSGKMSCQKVVFVKIV